jgi:phospholipid/cholesterol/gamma-HCH transport system substrate-binding protein
MFKVGVFAVIVILVSWWGIKWLGGQNILLSNNIYYVYYEDISGLQESSRVKLRGVEVGNVREITLEKDRVKVEIAIEDKYADMIPNNSVAEIASAGLMGGMEIYIVQGDAKKAMPNGGTFEGRVRPDMLGSMADKAGTLIEDLNTAINNVNALLEANNGDITGLISNLESISATIDELMATSSGDIKGAMSDLNTFTTTLAENSERIDAVIGNLETFSGDLAKADVVNQLSATVESLNSVLSAIENGEGSAGKLMYDDELYSSLTTAGDNLGLLLEDLKANPMRYVHFSLFGQSEDKAAEKAAKKAAREQKRAEKQEN